MKLAVEEGGMHTASELATRKGRGKQITERQAGAAEPDDSSASTSAKEAALEARMKMHRSLQARKVSKKEFENMMKVRQKLPAWQHHETVVKMVQDHQVVLVSGDTGCGKSTQIPQFILDSNSMGPGCKIACTQPRRISAIAVAERIADERCEEVGATVGYSIRLESANTEKTQLLFMTPGILLKKLNGDPLLTQYTHIIIDEVHERDRNSEFLLIVLRDLLEIRKDLKVILMSATLQQSKYSDYFGGCPITSIGAHTYPVQEFYLEDVLQQTGYLDKLGLNPVQASSKGLRHKGQHHSVSLYSCALCGKEGFRSAEELGTHAALCFGPQGMDPTMSELDISRLMGIVEIDDDFVAPEDALDEGSTVYAEEGDGEDAEADDPLSDAESSDDGRAVAAVQAWDGTGGFTMARAMSDKRANALLQRYQFSFDDEQVDYELIAQLLEYISESAYEEGAILVFLPGWDDISRQTDCLRTRPYFSPQGKFLILPLHSGVPTKNQREVFKRPPTGCRKIILSTNIAETSITIDDIAFVVDSGRAKEQNYDPHLKLRTLSPQWISKASARQRTGRAGRTRAGVCFHLFSRTRHSSLKDYQESELLRSSLEDIALQAKMYGITSGPPGSTAQFLSKAVDAPHALTVKNAVDLLVDIGAFDKEEELTDLGARLAGLSIEPQVGKMILWAFLLGCSHAAIKVGCAMTYKDPFVLPMGPGQKKDATAAKLALAKDTESDLIALLFALDGFESARSRSAGGAYAFADKNFLSGSTLGMISDIVRQLGRELMGLGMPNPALAGEWNGNVKDLSLLGSVLCAGLYPNVASRREKMTNFKTFGGTTAKIQLGSVNGVKGKSRLAIPCTAEEEYIAFHELTRSSQLFVMSNTTPVSPMALLLLCGNLQATLDDEADEEDGDGHQLLITLDDWIKLEVPRSLGEQLLVLRHRLHSAFARFVQHPTKRLSETDANTVKTVVTLLHDPSMMRASRAHSAYRPSAAGTVGRGAAGRGGSTRGRGPGHGSPVPASVAVRTAGRSAPASRGVVGRSSSNVARGRGVARGGGRAAAGRGSTGGRTILTRQPSAGSNPS